MKGGSYVRIKDYNIAPLIKKLLAVFAARSLGIVNFVFWTQLICCFINCALHDVSSRAQLQDVR